MKNKPGNIRRPFPILALLVTVLAPSTDAVACSCARPVLADMYKDSTHVIFGEVVKVELQTRNPVHGEKATYVATVKALETYKGPSNADILVTFTGTYIEPGRSLPPNPTEVDEATGEILEITLVGGCEWGMAVGTRYVAFEKDGEPLHYAGHCTQRVMAEGIVVLDYLRSLRDSH